MAAPLGIGVGDFVVVGKAVNKLYRRYRDCENEHGILKDELKQLDDLLTNLRELSARVKLTGTQFAQLVAREKDSQALIDDMTRILEHHEPPEDKKLSVVKKLTWNKTAADDLRARLTSQASMLNGCYLSISQTAVLDALEIVKLNMQAGKTKCPSLASMSQASVHEDDGVNEEWYGIIRDLENLGITAHMVKSHRDLTLRYFENAVAHGELPFARDDQSFYVGSVSGYRSLVQHWVDAISESGFSGARVGLITPTPSVYNAQEIDQNSGSWPHDGRIQLTEVSRPMLREDFSDSHNTPSQIWPLSNHPPSHLVIPAVLTGEIDIWCFMIYF